MVILKLEFYIIIDIVPNFNESIIPQLWIADLQ
jgi:hypothetical protein